MPCKTEGPKSSGKKLKEGAHHILTTVFLFVCFFWVKIKKREKNKGSKKENNNTKHKEKQAKA